MTRRLLALGAQPSAADWSGDPEPTEDGGEPPPSGARRAGAFRAVASGAAVVCVAVAVGAGGRLWWAGQGADGIVVPAAASTTHSAARAPHRSVAPTGPAATPTVAADGDAAAGAGGGGRLLVHVVGRVARPGLVTLSPGARVADVVAAGGGAVRGADLASVNLARRVEDGEQVLVLGAGEPASAAPGKAGAGPGTAGGSVVPVDLNTADAAALDALPGVGPVTAARIIEHRTSRGRFASVEDLAEVPGIGERTLERLRPLVRV